MRNPCWTSCFLNIKKLAEMIVEVKAKIAAEKAAMKK